MSPATQSPGYLTIARFSGDPGELARGYRRSIETMDGVGRDHGLIFHAGAVTPDGFVVVNLWPSKDGSESAARDPRRLEVVRELGLSPDRMHREHYEVAGYTVL